MCYFNEVPSMLETGHIQGLKSPLRVKGVIFLYLSLQLCNYIKFVPINRTQNRIGLLKRVLDSSHCGKGHRLRPEIQLHKLLCAQKKNIRLYFNQVCSCKRVVTVHRPLCDRMDFY